jgi:hypothetical protein
MQRLNVRPLALVAFETVLIVSAVAIAAYVRLGDFAWRIAFEEYGFLKAGLIALVAQTCLYYADLYDSGC